VNEPLPSSRPRVCSVASLAEALNDLLAGSIPDVGVQCEVCNALNARSGHWYFTRSALAETPLRDRSIPVQPLMTAPRGIWPTGKSSISSSASRATAAQRAATAVPEDEDLYVGPARLRN